MPSSQPQGVLLRQSPSRVVLTPGSKESPIAWLVAIWPPVVLGTSRGKGVARGQGGPVPCPMGLPPRQTARCVYPLAWADGAGKDQGWAGVPELPLRSGRQGKSRSGSSGAALSSPSKGTGSTRTTQASQILAGVGPTR